MWHILTNRGNYKTFGVFSDLVSRINKVTCGECKIIEKNESVPFILGPTPKKLLT
jgi:hypothetical protein